MTSYETTKYHARNTTKACGCSIPILFFPAGFPIYCPLAPLSYPVCLASSIPRNPLLFYLYPYPYPFSYLFHSFSFLPISYPYLTTLTSSLHFMLILCAAHFLFLSLHFTNPFPFDLPPISLCIANMFIMVPRNRYPDDIQKQPRRKTHGISSDL